MSGMDCGDVRSRGVDVPRRGLHADVLSGGVGGDAAPETGPLRPGDPVGVSLLGGDGEMGATGTVTHIDGDARLRVRPSVLQLRADRLPDDARARLRDAAQPDVVLQDRDDGASDRDDAAGSRDGDRGHARQGPGGRFRSRSRSTTAAAPKRTFRYTAVNDQLFTPLLTYVALFNTLGNYERQFGAMTFTVKGKATFDKHADLAYEDIFTGDGTIAARVGATSPARSRCCSPTTSNR